MRITMWRLEQKYMLWLKLFVESKRQPLKVLASVEAVE